MIANALTRAGLRTGLYTSPHLITFCERVRIDGCMMTPDEVTAGVERMKNGREMIIVTEIPYQVNKSNLLEKIADLVRDKKIEGISDLRDESDRDGMRVVIELKRDAQSEVILNQLYKHTTLQVTFSVNMLGLDHGVPKQMSLKQLISVQQS